MAEQLPATASFKLTWEDKLEKAHAYKNEGNASFKSKAHKSAIGKYHRALLYLKGIDASKQGSLMPNVFGDREVEVKMPEDVQEDFDKLKMDCYNNLAACIMLTESPAYEKVLQYCDEVLQLSPCNVKALYRKGVALYNLSRLDDALEELVKARSQPTGGKDRNIKRYIDMCQQRAKQQNKTLRQKYRTMFERMAHSDASATSNDTADQSDKSDHSEKSPDNETSSPSGGEATVVNGSCSQVTDGVRKLETSADCDNVTNKDNGIESESSGVAVGDATC